MSTVIEKIENGEYQPTTPLPKKPADPRRKMLRHDVTPNEIRELADEVEAYNEALNAYNRAKSIRTEEQAKNVKQFREDLAKEFNMIGHPIESKLWKKSWEKGDGDFLEVYNEYEDLRDLIVDDV